MNAGDIMTPNPSAVTPDEPVARAAEIMRELNVGIVPVVHDRSGMHLEGVITDRDIVIRCVALHHDSACRVGDHMTTGQLEIVRPEADVSEVIATMERHQVRRLPVVADGRRLVGILAQADLAVKLGPKAPLKVEALLERISEQRTIEPADAIC